MIAWEITIQGFSFIPALTIYHPYNDIYLSLCVELGIVGQFNLVLKSHVTRSI
jgi:hypothetical protein